jgi:hypothetical protein
MPTTTRAGWYQITNLGTIPSRAGKVRAGAMGGWTSTDLTLTTRTLH